MTLFFYNLFIHTVAPLFLAAYYLPRIVFGGKYRRSLWGKLGQLPADFVPDRLPRPRVWLHAVSVGEVVALGPMAAALKERLPHASLVVSTGTETGQDKARELIPYADGFFYLPLDFPASVNRVVTRIEPDLFVLLETELWPNLIRALKNCGSFVVLANGRISDRSFPQYRMLRPFLASTISKIDLFLMSSELDAERISVMGADNSRIRVTGNTKFDAALKQIPMNAEPEMRKLFGIERGTRVFVAGSTHPGENEVVSAAYKRLREVFPDLVLVLVPRHVERTPEIQAAIDRQGLGPTFLRSSADDGEKRDGRNIVIVDRTGELFQIFSIASVVFIGGSLVPKGGQNILEPAAWGKVVLFGPSMEDFREARDILVKTGAGIKVRGVQDICNQITRVLSDPEKARELGERGRQEILKHVGSAQRNADLLAELVRSMPQS